jgi:hypothetical protein
MIFQIEALSEDQSQYVSKPGQIFNELLEFYAYLNYWAVEPVTK